jgi:hypothetical protein
MFLQHVKTTGAIIKTRARAHVMDEEGGRSPNIRSRLGMGRKDAVVAGIKVVRRLGKGMEIITLVSKLERASSSTRRETKARARESPR